MNTNELIKRWKEEEEIAHIYGWDFSHIEGRYMEEDDLPWDYREEILRYLKPDMRILDIDTGGGEFLISLNRKMKDESLHFVNTNQCDKKIVEIIQYLNYHLTEEISIDGLADRFFVSKYHMMRRFKAETGYTIGNYINQKRLLYARELLKQGESVTKVYLDSGFKDHSTFVRAYKQMFHEVPSKRGLL